MPFTDIAPPPIPAGSSGTGISMSMSEIKKRGTKVRLTITEEMQIKMFGGPIHGKKFVAQVGRGPDEGLLRLVVVDDGDLVAKAGVKGSASIPMSGWDLLPKDKRPASSCELKSSPSNVEAILELPSWCKPSGVGGKIAAEHALKRPPGSNTGWG